MSSPERQRELRDRSDRIRFISKELMRLQGVFDRKGLSPEEMGYLIKLEKELESYIDDASWIVEGGGLEYIVAESLYRAAEGIRKMAS